jgi:hypothetical protein
MKLYKFIQTALNVTVVMVALLHIQEISGSYLSLKADYPYRFYHRFSKSLQADDRILPETRSRSVPSTSFPIH